MERCGQETIIPLREFSLPVLLTSLHEHTCMLVVRELADVCCFGTLNCAIEVSRNGGISLHFFVGGMDW